MTPLTGVQGFLAAVLLSGPAQPGPAATPLRAEAVAVFAGGCFWGVEAVFEHLRGVHSATSGYALGAEAASGAVPVEAVRILYDPEQISYEQLLEVFFTIAHDPTQRDRQGPDAGPEYRAVAFYLNPIQRQAITAYLSRLERSHAFARPVVTEIQQIGQFHVAESFHQDYGARHPNDPYIIINDAPKLEHLRSAFPKLYRD